MLKLRLLAAIMLTMSTNAANAQVHVQGVGRLHVDQARHHGHDPGGNHFGPLESEQPAREYRVWFLSVPQITRPIAAADRAVSKHGQEIRRMLFLLASGSPAYFLTQTTSFHHGGTLTFCTNNGRSPAPASSGLNCRSVRNPT